MQCRESRERVPRQILLERFYRARRLNVCNLFANFQNFMRSRHLGINCFKDKANVGNGYLISDYSTHSRKLNAIKQGRGSIKYSSLLLNDYGKIEGSPGGYGSSPKNRF